jgi:hypothetical protein
MRVAETTDREASLIPTLRCVTAPQAVGPVRRGLPQRWLGCFWRSPSAYTNMCKRRFDESDYSVVVKNRARPPNSWRWEIYRAGRSNPIGQSPVYFRTMAAASKAGKAALKQLLDELDT